MRSMSLLLSSVAVTEFVSGVGFAFALVLYDLMLFFLLSLLLRLMLFLFLSRLFFLLVMEVLFLLLVRLSLCFCFSIVVRSVVIPVVCSVAVLISVVSRVAAFFLVLRIIQFICLGYFFVLLPPPKNSMSLKFSLLFTIKGVCLSLDPLRRRSLLTRNLSVMVDAVLLRASSRQMERILRPLVPGTLFRASSFRTRVARSNERERCIPSGEEALSPLRLSI